jgi:hypothetical protein
VTTGCYAFALARNPGGHPCNRNRVKWAHGFASPALAELMTDNAFHPAYFETVFTGAFAAGELPAAFAIITAYAPTGQIWSEEENRLADGRLKTRLAKWPCWRITGQTPDGSHAEPGWAVGCDQAAALVIGKEFQQDAIYWVSQDDLIILDSAGNRTPARVGKFSPRYLQICSPDTSAVREGTTGVNVTGVNSIDSPWREVSQRIHEATVTNRAEFRLR